MKFFTVSKEAGIAVVCLARGKVNAINGEVVRQLHGVFGELEKDEETKAIILTGSGKFFSFGFDVPEFLSYTEGAFLSYVREFAKLCLYLFQFPKPVIAALNGHATAGGCMLAIACDFRIMAEGKAKIALNEIGFGSTVFASTVEMLRYWIGSRNAEDFLFSGRMCTAIEGREIGLIDETVPEEQVMPTALEKAREYAAKYLPAFAATKKLLRKHCAERIFRCEEDSLKEFIEIWYSDATRKFCESIIIR